MDNDSVNFDEAPAPLLPAEANDAQEAVNAQGLEETAISKLSPDHQSPRKFAAILPLLRVPWLSDLMLTSFLKQFSSTRMAILQIHPSILQQSNPALHRSRYLTIH